MPKSRAQQLPACQYGAACTRKGCIYRHPPKPPKKVHVPKTSEICVHYVSGCCSFPGCRMWHFSAKEQHPLT